MGYNKNNNTDRMLYLKGPLWWAQNKFWHEPGRSFSQAAKDYYDKWLSDMWNNERVQTKLQDKVQ